jgi:hypothetical protein
MTDLFGTGEAEAARQLFYFIADRPGVDEAAVERAWIAVVADAMEAIGQGMKHGGGDSAVRQCGIGQATVSGGLPGQRGPLAGLGRLPRTWKAPGIKASVCLLHGTPCYCVTSLIYQYLNLVTYLVTLLQKEGGCNGPRGLPSARAAPAMRPKPLPAVFHYGAPHNRPAGVV